MAKNIAELENLLSKLEPMIEDKPALRGEVEEIEVKYQSMVSRDKEKPGLQKKVAKFLHDMEKFVSLAQTEAIHHFESCDGYYKILMMMMILMLMMMIIIIMQGTLGGECCQEHRRNGCCK